MDKMDIIDEYYAKATSPGNEFKVYDAITRAVNKAYALGRAWQADEDDKYIAETFGAYPDNDDNPPICGCLGNTDNSGHHLSSGSIACGNPPDVLSG